MSCIRVLGVISLSLLVSAAWRSQPGARDYFPPEAFGHAGDEFYAQALAKMQEPVLAATGSPDREIYRFLWAPSFHPYAVVRAERTAAGIVLSAKRLNRDGSTGALTTLDRSVKKTLSDKQWRILSGRISTARFWETPSDDPDREHVVDGDDWILEGADATRHHGVARVLHENDRAFETACYCMLYWSGLDRALSDMEKYGHRDTRRRLAWACSAEPPKVGF